MPQAKKLISLLFIAMLLSCFHVSAQQSVLDKKVSFSFTDTQLATALRKISTQAGVKFSYNPDFIPTGKRITYKCKNQPLGEALKQLINDPDITFRDIGNQLVIYKGSFSNPAKETAAKILPAEKPVPRKTPDTVYRTLTDTVILHKTDTVFQTINTIRIDTVRITDTVYKYRTQKTGKRPKNPFANNSVKQQKFLENNGLYAGLYAEMLPGSASFSALPSGSQNYAQLMQKASLGGGNKFSAGLLAGYDYFRFGVRSGIGITRLGEKFDFTFTKETGGYYLTDTVETYYALHGIDTAWFYITDSSWVPKTIQNNQNKNLNTFHYLDIPVMLKFRLWQNESAEVYALGGITGSFLLKTNSLRINPANNESAGWTAKSELSPAVFSVKAGIGGALKLGSRAGILGELTYRGQLNNQYKDLPVKKTYSLAGLSVGAYFKL